MALINPNLRSRVTPDGAIVLDISRDAMTALNLTGAYIWERLTRGLDTNSIVADLACDTGTDPKIVEQDVIEFMAEMESRNLIFPANETRL